MKLWVHDSAWTSRRHGIVASTDGETVESADAAADADEPELIGSAISNSITDGMRAADVDAGGDSGSSWLAASLICARISGGRFMSRTAWRILSCGGGGPSVGGNGCGVSKCGARVEAYRSSSSDVMGSKERGSTVLLLPRCCRCLLDEDEGVALAAYPSSTNSSSRLP